MIKESVLSPTVCIYNSHTKRYILTILGMIGLVHVNDDKNHTFIMATREYNQNHAGMFHYSLEVAKYIND